MHKGINKMARAVCVAATLSLALTACGGKVENVLKDATLDITQNAGDTMASLTTELDTQNLIISAASLQVDKGLGMVEIVNDITTQKTYLKLSFDVGKALNLPAPTYSSTLPNGLTLPLTGIDLSKVMAFNVGANGSKVYLYYDMAAKKAVLGVALNVDSLKTDTPATALASFSFNKVTGLAGLYTGSQAHTSGLSVLVDLSGAIPSSAQFLTQSVSKPVEFVPSHFTDAQQGRVDRRLFELSVMHTPIVIK